MEIKEINEIQEIQQSDAKEFVKFNLDLLSETEFLLQTPEESPSLEKQVNIIGSLDRKKSNMFIAKDRVDGKIIGFIFGRGGVFEKNKHVISLVMGVTAGFRGKYVGSELFNTFKSWCNENGFSRIELSVMEHNERAIKFYRSLGFVEEGVKKDSIYQGGRFINEISMSSLAKY